MEKNETKGHLIALCTIVLWGTTFISTKILLTEFKPVEILFIRFVIAFFALLVICPQRLKGTTLRQEISFAAAGFCGICLYYLLENIALTYTLASNVGVITSLAPFFTAILSRISFKEEKLTLNFFVGFVVAMIGIFLISFNVSALEVNLLGDLLALLAAFVWACYSLLIKKINGFGCNILLSTRRIFFYGIVCMIPALFLFDFHPKLVSFRNPVYVFNIAYLGLGASALCFVTWNIAVKILGAIKTSVYIYMIPVITVTASVVVLHEKLTVLSGVGAFLAMSGLVLSEGKSFLRKN